MLLCVILKNNSGVDTIPLITTPIIEVHIKLIFSFSNSTLHLLVYSQSSRPFPFLLRSYCYTYFWVLVLSYNRISSLTYIVPYQPLPIPSVLVLPKTYHPLPYVWNIIRLVTCQNLAPYDTSQNVKAKVSRKTIVLPSLCLSDPVYYFMKSILFDNTNVY